MKLATTTTPLQPQQWQAVSEQDSLFLALFPHRFDFLWSEHPDPGIRPEWKTESKHPLSDRHIQQGAYLYGVRFGKLTRYLVLDIDRHSLYHPMRDPWAIGRMMAALEAVGLVASVPVTSSYSGGIHLYLPFEQPQETWAIALVVSTLLEQAGFKLKPGQLELFPNPRPYINGTPSLYTGHRVPMQAGSYLLNQHWEQVYSDQAAFVRQWQWAEQRNDLHHKTLQRVLKQAQRQRYKSVTVSAQKFLNDLQTEVECGWTGTGQTNWLLGRITMREYIFGHVLRGGDPLTGQALVDAIMAVAVALPGYTEYCRHQHEIHKLARDRARSIEADPNYYPYDPSKRAKTKPHESQPQNNIVSFQQALALDAAQRIKTAIATLQATDEFPTGATARAAAIIAMARCSNQTLHKHKALWHPDHAVSRVGTLTEAVAATDGNPAVLPPETLEPLPEGGLHDFTPNKFMPHPAALPEQAERQLEAGGSGGLSTGDVETFATGLADMPDSSPPSASQGMISADGAVVSAAETIAQAQAQRQRERQAATAARMTQWLESCDPILIAEAEQWFAANTNQQRREPPTERGDPSR